MTNFVFVPVEPTTEMVAAAHGVDAAFDRDGKVANAITIYRAMLAAAPVAPAGSDDPQEGRWYAAEDIDSMVRDLDKALNGDGAARQAKLCDIYPQIIALAARAQPPVGSDALISPAGEVSGLLGRYIAFNPSSEEGNAVLYPERPAEGCYWTLIGSGPDHDQNRLAAEMVERLNAPRGMEG